MAEAAPSAAVDKDAELVAMADGKTDPELSAAVLAMRANGSLKGFCQANKIKGRNLQWAAYDFLKDLRDHLALSFPTPPAGVATSYPKAWELPGKYEF